MLSRWIKSLFLFQRPGTAHTIGVIADPGTVSYHHGIAGSHLAGCLIHAVQILQNRLFVRFRHGQSTQIHLLQSRHHGTELV